MKIKLENLAKVKTGLVLSRYKSKNDSEPTFSYKTISLKSFADFPNYNHQFSEEFLSSKRVPDAYFAQKGDVVIRLKKPFNAVYIAEDYQDFICNSITAIITVRSEKILPEYLAYILNTPLIEEQLESNITGSQENLINTSDLKNLNIPIVDLALQQKIIDYSHLVYEEKQLLENLIAERYEYSNTMIMKLIKTGMKHCEK